MATPILLENLPFFAYKYVLKVSSQQNRSAVKQLSDGLSVMFHNSVCIYRLLLSNVHPSICSIAVIPASNQTLPNCMYRDVTLIYPTPQNKSSKNHFQHRKNNHYIPSMLTLQRYGLLIFQRYKFISKTYSFASGLALEANKS